MIDYHIHTKRCCHAVGEMEEYLAKARERGLKEIGFSDHFPLDLLGYTPKNKVSMSGEELEDYINEVLALAGQSHDITVRLGVEVDYLPGCEDATHKLLMTYPFDYVMGSIHFLDGWDFTHPAQIKGFEDGCVKSIYSDYFKQVENLAASRLFDIIAHADVVKKFGFHLEGEERGKTLATLVEKIKEADLCVEVNTSGWRAPVAEQYPSRDFLEACLEKGVAVTLGSDAHSPTEVGEGLEKAMELLRDVGYRRIALFHSRKRRYINL